MKEILQTKSLILKSPVACASAHAFLHFFHIENIARVVPTIEVQDPEEVYQEEQQEFEVVDQFEEQFPETNLANSNSQQGKHRFILKPRVFYTSLSFMQF